MTAALPLFAALLYLLALLGLTLALGEAMDTMISQDEQEIP